MKSYRGEAIRFLGAGVFNTAIGYLIYLGALFFTPYRIAYTISYAAGIIVSYAINTSFVFGEKWSWKKLAAYPLIYLVQYLVGITLLSILVEELGVPSVLAPILVVVATIPLTFLSSRYVIKRKIT